jgi:hypothetical protein
VNAKKVAARPIRPGIMDLESQNGKCLEQEIHFKNTDKAGYLNLVLLLLCHIYDQNIY